MAAVMEVTIMADKKKKRAQKPERQDWKPHWTLMLLYKLWMFVYGTFKLAIGAVATVLIICNFLTVGASLRLGNMLFVLLAIISSPMICGQIWVISLFGWSYLLFACFHGLRSR
jgi:hypothetical protein